MLANDSPEARELLFDGCGRAIARAADLRLAAQLAARGEAMGLQDLSLTDDAIEADAVAAVRDARASRLAPANHDEATHPAG